MTSSVVTYLLFITAVVMVTASDFRAATPMEKAFQDVRSQHRTSPLGRHTRDTRIAPETVPCVTISFLKALKERFVHWMDKNNDGMATFDEVKDHLRLFKPNVKDAAVEAFIRRRDTNGNHAIDLIPEYVQDMSIPDYTIEGASEWFHLQDTDNNGSVTEKELVDAAQAMGMSPEEAADNVQGYYMVADVDKDGKLAFDEFKTLYNQ